MGNDFFFCFNENLRDITGEKVERNFNVNLRGKKNENCEKKN